MNIDGLNIDFLGHSGFLIEEKGGKRIAIDPYILSSNVGKADIILITHSHYDHCSIKDIAQIAQPGTRIVIPPDAQSKITRIEEVDMQILEMGDEITLGEIKIEGFPAYNIGKNFHPKNEGWLGYVIKLEKSVIYHSGDSDHIPEMQKLTGYGKHGGNFIVLLPVSGTYVMTAEEAAEVAVMLKPTCAIPMHYGAGVAGTREDAERFVQLFLASDVRAEILEKI